MTLEKPKYIPDVMRVLYLLLDGGHQKYDSSRPFSKGHMEKIWDLQEVLGSSSWVTGRSQLRTETKHGHISIYIYTYVHMYVAACTM